MNPISIGEGESGSLIITVLDRENPLIDDFDHDMLDCELLVRSGGFIGNVKTHVSADDLINIWASLAILHKDREGNFSFKASSAQLEFTASCEFDQVSISGVVTEFASDIEEFASMGNRLFFCFTADQASLAASVKELERVIGTFAER